MIINIIDQQKDLKINAGQVRRLVQNVISLEGQKCDEVNIYFVDIPSISSLHAQFFDDPSPTDCISFPIDVEETYYRILGEVFVCPAIAKAYAQEHKEKPGEEVSLYIVHGLLHLMGYDDIEDEEIDKMRKAEQRHIEDLKSKKLIEGVLKV